LECVHAAEVKDWLLAMDKTQNIRQAVNSADEALSQLTGYIRLAYRFPQLHTLIFSLVESSIWIMIGEYGSAPCQRVSIFH
jgi:hypothetical protein